MASRGRGGSISDWDPMRDDYNDSSFNAQYPDDTSDNQLDLTRLYITKLPPALSQEGLLDLFSKYGTVVHSFCSRDVLKRYAFIGYETAGEARIAMMKLNRTEPFNMHIAFANKRTSSVPGRTSQPHVDRSHSNNDRQMISHSTTDRPNQNMNNVEDSTSVSSKGRKTRNVEHVNGDDVDDETEGSEMDPDPKLGYDLEKIKLKRLEIMDQQLEVQQRMLIHQQRMKLNASGSTRRRLLPDGRSIQVTRNNETSITAGGGDSRNIPRLQREGSRRCVSCGAAAELFCAGCRVTPYCAERCQRRDWEARHRAVCHNLARSTTEAIENHASSITAPDIPAVTPLRKPHAVSTKSPCVGPTSDSGSERGGMKFIPPSEKHAALQEAQRRGNQAANNNRNRQEGTCNRQDDSRNRQEDTRNRQDDSRNRQEHTRNHGNQANRLDKQGGQEDKALHHNSNQAFSNRRHTPNQPLRQPKQLTPEPTKPARLEPTPPEPKPESENPSVIAARLASIGDVTPRKPLVPARYVVEKLPVGAEFLAETVSLASECGSKQLGCVCLTLHDDYSEMYDRLCEDFKQQCQKDNEVYTPRIGETFAYLCEDDGFWYRARCLARTRAALLDAGRVVSLSPSACRRLPPTFANIPEFMALLKTKDFAIGSNLSCKVISLSGGITVSVEDSSGTRVQVEAARWTPDVQYTDEPQNLPREANLKQPTPEPQTTKPAQDEPSPRAICKPREAQVAESRPKSSVNSRLATEATRQPLVPDNYVIEKLPVGAEFLAETVSLASECGSKQLGCVCLTLHDDYSEMYDRLCEDFKQQCQKDNEVYTPRIGETFAYLCEDDGFWYRARCLARTRAALLDAGRVVSLSPSACRRLPPTFANIPEFMALLKTKDLAIGSNLCGKVISLSSAGITVSVEDASGTRVQVEAARWTPDVQYTDEPQNLSREANLKQPTPEPQNTNPAQDEPSPRAIQPCKLREAQVAESRPKSSVNSRLATEATRQPLVPDNYVIEKLPVGAEFLAETVSLASECGSKQLGCVCLTLHDDYSEMYDRLCEDFKQQCQKDNEVYTPRIGETFAYLCEDDGFWYRARCLARTRAALLDAGRVVSLSPSACRRLPPTFANIPEFMALLKTEDFAIGSNLSCKVISLSSAGITVSVEDASGTRVQVEAARWTPDVQYTDEPAQRPPLRQPNLRQPTPDPQTTKPAQLEPSFRKQREPVESKKPESVGSRLNNEVTRKPLVPANYVIEKLPVGAEFLAETVSLASECGSKQLGCVCLTLHDDYSEMYDRLCEDFKQQCQKDNEVYTPRIGETFAYLCEDDGFWYRARCLARTRAALLDAGRVVSLSPSACRRLPPTFANIPEFMALLKTKDLEIGCHFSCKVISLSSAGITVSVEDASGTRVQVEAARWTPDVQYTDEPVAASKSTSVSLPTPIAASRSATDVSKPALVPEVPRPGLERNTVYLLLDVTSLRRACVRPCDPRPVAAFDAVLQDTVLYGVNAIPLKEPPQKGQTVVAKFIEDGTHYRAFVKRVNVALNKYLIEYIEYGNEEIVPFERLYVCPPKLQLDVKPAQASLVKLSEREPVTLSPAAVKYVDTLKENAVELILTIPGGDKTAPSGSLVTLLMAKNCEPVSKKIEDLCIPEWKKLAERGGDVLEMETRFFSQLKYLTIPTNRPFNLRVTYCDAKQLIKGAVCGYEKGNKAADLVYGELTKQITEYCESPLCNEPYLPKIEELCIAKNTQDNAWVRSVLMELPQGAGSRTGSMLHVDCGLIEDVPVANLRRIPPELVDAYPALANHLEIKDFPLNKVSQQQVLRAMRFMKMTPEGTGELRVTGCRVIDDNIYEVDVPELIDILTQ